MKYLILSLLALVISCTDYQDMTLAELEKDSDVASYRKTYGHLFYLSNKQLCNLAYDVKKDQWRKLDRYVLTEVAVRDITCFGNKLTYQLNNPATVKIRHYRNMRREGLRNLYHKDAISQSASQTLQNITDKEICLWASRGETGFNKELPYYVEEAFRRDLSCKFKISKSIQNTGFEAICISMNSSSPNKQQERYPYLTEFLSDNDYSCH